MIHGFRGTYKFIIDFDAAKYQSDARRVEQIDPFFLVRLVDVNADVACPVHSSGFGISDVGDIIHMSCSDQVSDIQCLRELSKEERGRIP